MRKVRGYIFSRPFMGERIPQHVQNLVIRDYCERNKLHYLLSATEYAMAKCHLIHEQVLAELPLIDGIVYYSLFQLPEETKTRQHIYQKILVQKKTLYFAVEGLSAHSQKDCDRVEILWQTRLIMPFCIDSI
jgi:sporadic carbohydrate cluster protein (TIGR04323 family)